MQYWFCKSMDLQLSKTVPIIILRHFIAKLNSGTFGDFLRFLPKNHDFGRFSPIGGKIWKILKIDLEVAATFLERFWKAQDPYFPFPTSEMKFWPFCNPNGKCESQHQKPIILGIYRSGFKRASKIRDFVDAISFSENMDQELFKSGLRMCLRPLVMILWSYQGW